YAAAARSQTRRRRHGATTNAGGYGSLPSQGRHPACRCGGARTTEGHSRRGALGGELCGLVLGGQRVDQLVQRLSRDHLWQLVERQIDAVVGDAALREIIGADALAAVA